MRECFFAGLLLACGGPAAPDAGVAMDASIGDAGRDASMPEVAMDAGTDAQRVDAGSDSGSEDASMPVDAGPSLVGPVQCTTDCPGISLCNREAPGGSCYGCGADDDCPDGTSCNEFGACARSCESDAECNIAWYCDALGSCRIRSCGPSMECPAPYVCGGDGRCERPSCAVDPCPAPLRCESSLCVEP